MGRGLRLKDVSRSKKMYFEQICAEYFIVRPSVGRRLRLEDYLEARRCIMSLNCEAFGGSSVKTRRCIWRQEDIF